MASLMLPSAVVMSAESAGSLKATLTARYAPPRLAHTCASSSLAAPVRHSSIRRVYSVVSVWKRSSASGAVETSGCSRAASLRKCFLRVSSSAPVWNSASRHAMCGKA
eukprot:scaffold14982_cov62-Phaeocystis_antarctica.AAC.2